MRKSYTRSGQVNGKRNTCPNERFTESRIRVRYAETDQMGVAYYSNYFIWFEVARVDYCRAHGVNYDRLEREEQVFLAVSEARCRYLRPARYDEQILVRTRVSRLRRRSMTFSYDVFLAADNVHLAEGETVHVFLNAQGRPRTLPSAIARLLLG